MRARTALVSVVTAALLTGGTVVTAAPAQAMSIRACYNATVPGVWGVYMWEDYSWYEEVFLGQRDRWVWRAWMRCA